MSINTCDKESETSRCRGSTPVHLYLIYFNFDRTAVFVDGMHYFAPQITVLCVIMMARATAGHLLIWIRTAKQTATRWYRGIFKLKYVFIGERDKGSTKSCLW